MGLFGYTNKIKIPIGSSDDGELTNHQIKFTLVKGSGTNTTTTTYLDNLCLNWPDDIRFTGPDGTTLIDFWREEYDATDGTWWVEVPTIPASGGTAIYLYYGNSSASDLSNGTNTFSFFDDFEDGSIDTDKWTVGNGVNEHDGILHVNVSTSLGTTQLGVSSKTFTINPTTAKKVIEVKTILLTDNLIEDWFIPLGLFYDSGNRLNIFTDEESTKSIGFQKVVSGTPTLVGSCGSWAFGTSFNLKMIINAGTIKGYKDDGGEQSTTYSVNQNHKFIFNKFDGGAAGGRSINVSNQVIFVREYAADEPELSAGTKEFNAVNNTIMW